MACIEKVGSWDLKEQSPRCAREQKEEIRYREMKFPGGHKRGLGLEKSFADPRKETC